MPVRMATNKKSPNGNSLVVQWLGLCAFTAGGTGSIPGWGTKISQDPIIDVGECVEKREPSYTVGGNVTWCSHYGKQYGGSLKN